MRFLQSIIDLFRKKKREENEKTPNVSPAVPPKPTVKMTAEELATAMEAIDKREAALKLKENKNNLI